MNSRMLRVLMVFLAFSSGVTAAQKRPKVGIFEVALQEQSPTRQTLGRSIDLQLESRTKLPSKFHVRLIRGRIRELIASGKRHPEEDDCVSFPSIVIKLSSSASDGALHLGTLEDPAYLRRIDRDHLGPEDYVLIFEEGDQPTNSLIRIHKNDLENYFRFGFPMQLGPSERLSRAMPEVVATAARTLERRSEEFRRMEDRPVALARPGESPCWAVRLQPEIANATKPRSSITMAASLEDCTLQPNASAGAAAP